MEHVEQTILLLSVFDGTKPPSHKHDAQNNVQEPAKHYGVWKGRSFHCLHFYTEFMAFWYQQHKNKPSTSQMQIHAQE